MNGKRSSDHDAGLSIFDSNDAAGQLLSKPMSHSPERDLVGIIACSASDGQRSRHSGTSATLDSHSHWR